MAVLITVGIFALLITFDWIFRPAAKEEAAARDRATAREGGSELFYHAGLSWVRPREDGQVTIGTSEFCSRFVGALAAVELPRVGARLRQGEPAWTLVSKRGRRLAQVMPVSGIVADVNYELLREPELLVRSPLQVGWCIRVVPEQLEQGLSSLLPSRMAGEWLESLKSIVVAKLQPACGAVAADGGEAVLDLGDRLDDGTWQELVREVFPPGTATAAGRS